METYTHNSSESFDQCTIFEYLDNEVGKNATKKKLFQSIVDDIYSKTGFSNIIRIKGDGNCLIRSILKYYEIKLPNFYNVVITNIFIMADEDIILPCQLYEFNLSTSEYEEKICQIIRKLIIKKWDYKGSAKYHMDINSIDGSAISMSMRLLGVGKLNIFQAFEGAGR